MPEREMENPNRVQRHIQYNQDQDYVTRLPKGHLVRADADVVSTKVESGPVSNETARRGFTRLG
jgi:hypothetical protein